MFPTKNELRVGIKFETDNQQLDISKQKLNELIADLQSIQKQNKQAGLLGKTNEELKEASQNAAQLEHILKSSWNSKLGQLDIGKFNNELRQSKLTVEQLKSSLDKVSPTAFNKIASSILNTNLELKKTSTLLDKMALTMANTVRFGISSMVFNNLTNSIQKAYDYSVKLDSSLNDIRIVTNKSAEDMDRFAVQANKAAQNLGKSTRDYTEASLIYYQQGLSDEETATRTETTLKAANVTGQSPAEVSEQLTAVWNGYKVSAAETELYVDKLAAVAAASAADLEELSTGMSKVASAAKVMGVDVDQLNAQLATIVSVTREAPETIGTSLKTVYARMSDIQAGLDSETSLGKYSGKMAEFGINVLDAEGKLRNMGDIVEEIGEKWSSLTREQRVSLAQTIAGQRQYSRMISLFDSWEKYEQYFKVSQNALGTLQKQQDIYMDRTQAHLQQLSTEAERTYDILFDTKTVNGFVDSLTGLLSVFNNLIAGVGGGASAFTYLGSIATSIFNQQIGGAITRQIENLEKMRKNADMSALKQKIADMYTMQGETGVNSDSIRIEKEAEVYQKIAGIKNQLSQDEYNQLMMLQKQIGLSEEKLKNAENYKDLLVGIFKNENVTYEEMRARLKVSQEQEKEYNKQMYDLQKLDSIWLKAEEGKATDEEKLGLLNNLKEIQKSGKDLQFTEQEIQKISLALEGKNINTKEIWDIFDEKAASLNNKLKEQYQIQNKINTAMERKKFYNSGEYDKEKQAQEERERLLQEEVQLKQRQQAISALVQSLSTVVTLVTTISGIVKTINDDSLTTEEKVKQILTVTITTLPIIIPQIVSIAKQLPTIAIGLGVVDAGNKAVTKSAIKSGAALWGAYWPILAMIAAIAAALVGLNKLIKIAADNYNKVANEAKNAAATAQRLREQAQSLADTQKQLETSFEAYKTAEEKIESCTKGTKEWQENLETVNTTVKDVLENLDKLGNVDLGKIFTVDKETGRLTIDQEAMKGVLEEANFQTQTAEMTANRAEYEAILAQNKSDLTDISRDMLPGSWVSNPAWGITGGMTLGTALLGPGGIALGSAAGGLASVLADSNVDNAAFTLSQNLEKLSDTNTIDDFRTDLENLGFTTKHLSDSELKDFQTSLKQASDEQKLAAQKLESLNTIAIQNWLGGETDAATVGLVQKNIDIETASRQKKYEEQLLDYSNVGDTSKVQYDNILRQLNKAGYNYTAGKNIIQGSGDKRTFEFKDANDKVVTMGYKEIASVLANMDAADQYKGAGEEYKQLWQQIEDKRGKAFADSLKEFYSSGNLENLSKSQVDQLKEWNQRNPDDISKELGVDYNKLVSPDMYSAFDEAATNYETAAADLVSKYDSAIQANFKKIDPENNLDISLVGKKVLLDALNEAFKEGGDEGLTELSNKFSEMSKEELKTYVDDLVKELKAKEDDTILLSDAEKELLKTYGYSEEAFVDYVKQLREVNKELANNKEQAKEVAMANVRMNKGLETLSKGFKDWNEVIEDGIKNGKELSPEYREAMTEIENALEDVFNVDNVPDDFVKGHLKEIEKLADGDISVLEGLQKELAQYTFKDIFDVDSLQDLPQEVQNVIAGINALDLDDIEIGTSLDETGLYDALQAMIDNTDIASAEMERILNQIGFEPDIETKQIPVKDFVQNSDTGNYEYEYVDAEGNTRKKIISSETYNQTGAEGFIEIPVINAKTTSFKGANAKGVNFNNSHGGKKTGKGKSGGGGGGGGSSKKADKMENLKEEIDRYHDVNIKLEQIGTTLDRLEDAEEKAFGGDLVKNYNNQIKALNNQITVTQQKLGIAADEMKELQGKLSGSGVRFNSDGTIGNYAAALKAQEDYVNGIINHYNSLGADAQESYKETVEQAKENFDKFKENLERYDKLVTDEIPDLQNQIQEAIDKITEKNIEKFKMEVDLRLDMAEAERDWNEFKKKVIDQIDDDDILGNAKARIEDLRTYLNDLDTGEVQALGKHVKETLDELRAFDKGLDNVYGRERAQSLEDLEEYFDNLKDALEEIVEIQDELQEDVLDQMDAVQDKIDDQVDTFEAISDLIEHDMTLIQLTLGEDAYAELSNFYKAQQDNYNKQLDFQRQQVDYWKQQMDAVEQGSEQFDAAREKWADAVADWNDLVENTIENLQDQLENTINAIFKNLNDNLTNNKGLQYVSDEFEIVGERAEQFLDEINRLQGIADLADKYQDAINNTDNISAQRKLNAAMEEQLNTLKSAERLSEKDIERAQKKYDLTVAQIALEEAQAQKNTLRLRRDTQGNYRYQYVADDEAVNEAENKLKEAYNSLYNFDKERYLDNLDEALDVWNEYQEKMAEAAQINDPELAQQKAQMIYEEYGEIINGIVEQNEKIRTDLRESAFMDLANLKQEEYDTYMNMTQEEQDVIVNGLVPQWEGGIQQMLSAIKDEGGFEPTTTEAFDNIKQAAEDYDAAVQDIQEDINATVGDVLDGEDKIIAINQDLTVSNNDVVDSYKAELTAVQELAAGVNDLADAYKDELQAAKDAHDYLAKQREEAAKAAAAAEKGKTAAKETVATPLPETKPAQTTAAPAPAQNSAPSLSKGSFVNVKAGTKWYYTSYGGRSGTARSGSIKYINLKGPYSYNIEGLGWIRKTDIVGYDTGGYTGEWNNGGKLGVLHQKELVLNAKDTRNLLDTVAIMRNITAAVGENTLQRLSGATSGSYIANGDGKGILEQDVHITANFPNVRSAIEIETALNNLTNAASQYIGKQ